MGRVSRGEIWTVAGGVFSSKPRPAVVMQADVFDSLDSVIVCPLTSRDVDAPLFRIELDPTTANGLMAASFAMVDKTTCVRDRHLRQRIGRLEAERLRSIERALVVFLGIGH